MKLFLLLTSLSCLCVIRTERIVFYTAGDSAYQFFPLCTNYLEFNVVGTKDIYIILTNSTSQDAKSYEIIIGGWDNKKSVIRKDGVEKVYYNGVVVDNGIYQKFWVSINDADEIVSMGKEAGRPLMIFNDPSYEKKKYFGVATGRGANGKFDFDFAMLAACNCPRRQGKHEVKFDVRINV